MNGFARILTAIGVVALQLAALGQQGVAPRLPAKFIPTDTSRLMGSPDPLPLEAVRAFPKLTFERPTELTHAGDGSNRIFVVEQQGVIRVFENRQDVAESSVFLDIRKVVLREGNEEGLLGLAFHPKYRENGEFFVYYSTMPRASVIARFRVAKDDPNRADRASEEILLRIDQPYENHNGGSIKFGPDGFLYIGLGDGGLADDPHGNGQNVGTLLGSILRIDVDKQDAGLKYAVPPDNPFVNRRNARGEIWAYGFRNVWRLAFDRETGNLFAGDVGQDRFEEVNLVVKGGNYGWNYREGFNAFEPDSPAKTPDLLDPLAEYFRGEGQSVTGGLVYRGGNLREYEGAYFYGDYLSGNVWALRWDGKRVVENRKVAKTGLGIAAFGEDQQGEMYLCTFDGGLYSLRQREIDLKATAQAFPRKLSETGLFDSVEDNRPAASLIPYEVNVPFWSDFAVKDRYIALPKEACIEFDEREKWQFPVGTVFVKTFWMHRDRVQLADPVRLETRLFLRAPDGWAGYTYVYNDDGSDADLLDASRVTSFEITTERGTVRQPYYFPSRVDCMACHTKAEGFVLGMTTRQMNRELAVGGETENQLAMLARLGAFAKDLPQAQHEAFPNWGFGNFDRSGKAVSKQSSPRDPHEKPAGDLNALARAYLEVNCAVCHRPEGIAPHQRDLRFHTPLAEANLVGRAPKQGHFVAPGGSVVTAGVPDQSELLLRAAHRGERQMPPLASKLPDRRGLEVLRAWIKSLAEQQ